MRIPTLFLWCSISLTCTGQDQNPESSEQLRANAPDAWRQVYNLQAETSRLAEFVPAGETDIKWTAKVSFESFPPIDTDPIELLLEEARSDNEKCKFVQHFNLYSGLENAYETSVRLFMCGNNQATGKGEIKIIKAIKGKEHFYLIRLITRIEPFEVNKPDFSSDIIATWSTYLRGITLCDTMDENYACPGQ